MGVELPHGATPSWFDRLTMRAEGRSGAFRLIVPSPASLREAPSPSRGEGRQRVVASLVSVEATTAPLPLRERVARPQAETGEGQFG